MSLIELTDETKGLTKLGEVRTISGGLGQREEDIISQKAPPSAIGYSGRRDVQWLGQDDVDSVVFKVQYYQII
jgi:hypothetical protein